MYMYCNYNCNDSDYLLVKYFFTSRTIVRPCFVQEAAQRVPMFILLLQMGQDAVKEM